MGWLDFWPYESLICVIDCLLVGGLFGVKAGFTKKMWLAVLLSCIVVCAIIFTYVDLWHEIWYPHFMDAMCWERWWGSRL